MLVRGGPADAGRPLKIREIAESHSIPIVEDKPLARSLYENVEIDTLIRPQFYKAVAEIIFFLHARKTRQYTSRDEELEMLKQYRKCNDEREVALAVALKEVAAELRLIDAVDLVAFIRTGQFGNVRSLVNASTEMYFKPGTMSFAESGDVSLNWTGEPSVVLDMEFHHRRVDVFFRLLLESEQAGVEIEYISFNGPSPDPATDTRHLIDAIVDARFALAAPRTRAVNLQAQ